MRETEILNKGKESYCKRHNLVTKNNPWVKPTGTVFEFKEYGCVFVDNKEYQIYLYFNNGIMLSVIGKGFIDGVRKIMELMDREISPSEISVYERREIGENPSLIFKNNKWVSVD